MRAAVDYVIAHPGCVMREVAHAISPSPTPSRCEAYGYDPVWRAVRAGLLEVRPHPTHKNWTVLYPVGHIPATIGTASSD
jgi:hypothetical protein